MAQSFDLPDADDGAPALPALASDPVRAQPHNRLELERRLARFRFLAAALVFAQAIHSAALLLFFGDRLSLLSYSLVVYGFLLVIVLAGWRALPEPLRYYGLDRRRILPDLKISWFWAAIALLLALAGRVVLIRAGVEPVQFDWSPRAVQLSILNNLVIYPLTAFLQELVVRGFFQNFFVSLFGGSRTGRGLAIAAASLVFAQFHLAYGFSVFFLAFAMSLGLGALFERTRSVFGPALVHTMIGAGMLTFSPV